MRTKAAAVYYLARDVAREAGISADAVRQAADAGRIRYIRTVGHVRLFERRDVRQFIAERTRRRA